MTPVPKHTASSSALSSSPSATIHKTIDQQAALISLVRLWLVARDEALFCFVSALDPANPDDPADWLSNIDLSSAIPAVDRMNQLREQAIEMVGKIGRNRAGQAMAEAISVLLSTESPKFLLRVDGVPEAF